MPRRKIQAISREMDYAHLKKKQGVKRQITLRKKENRKDRGQKIENNRKKSELDALKKIMVHCCKKVKQRNICIFKEVLALNLHVK